MSGPVTSVARVEDVQIFLKDPVYTYTHSSECNPISKNECMETNLRSTHFLHHALLSKNSTVTKILDHMQLQQSSATPYRPRVSLLC